MPSRTDHFRALVAQQPENELFRFSLAQSLAGEGSWSEALPHYDYCAAKKSDWMMAHIGRAKALLQIGRREEARPVLETALRLAIEQHHEDPERELRALLGDLR